MATTDEAQKVIQEAFASLKAQGAWKKRKTIRESIKSGNYTIKKDIEYLLRLP